MYTSIDKSDYNPNDFARFMRQYRFENSILEFSAGTEINFFDFNLHGSDKLFTPYIFMGLDTLNMIYFIIIQKHLKISNMLKAVIFLFPL